MTAKQDLEKSACDIVHQYRSGLIPKLQTKGWPMVWKDLSKELRSRCPGFSELQYGIALNQGFVNGEQCAEIQKKHGQEAVNGSRSS
jgi:hypothetical protein